MQKCFYLLVFFVAFVGCKDEINTPVYDSQQDIASPVINVSDPLEDGVYIGQTTVPINFTVTDDYQLEFIECKISKYDGTPVVVFDETTTDSAYTASETLTLPATDSTLYVTQIFARDFVGNITTKSFTFTAK